jgi:hypothetical protein
VAEDITFLMMCAMFRIAPLFGGTVVLLDRKKCPPAWFCAFGLKLRGRRVWHLLAWPSNRGAGVFVALCLQLVWMIAMLWR